MTRNIVRCYTRYDRGDSLEIKEQKPRVRLIAYTQMNEKEMGKSWESPEQVVAAAAKLCYSKVGCDEILDNLTPDTTGKFVKMLSDIGHESPFEHLNFTFSIEGISRTCSHQIVRHRHGSFSQQSQRYVDLQDHFSIVVPEAIQNNEKAKLRFINSVLKDYDAYLEITEDLYQEYIEKDHLTTKEDLKKARKKALEDARFALPNACETKLVMTMNARCLFNFFRERCCNRAQWEIREVANQMLDQVLEVASNVFAKAGAPCVYGTCKEGKMSCGQPIAPREKQPQKVKRMNEEATR